MAGFDPDAYLAKSAPSFAPLAFDPDEYLALGSTPRATGNPLVDQIPGSSVKAPAATAPIAPASTRKLGIIEQAASAPLTAATIFTSGPASIAGMWGEALGGRQTGEAVRNALTFPTYTEAQARQLEAAARALDAAHLPPTLGGAGIPLNALAGPAMSQATTAFGTAAKPVVQAVKQPLAQRAARIAQEVSAKDWQRAPQIEAAQKAPQYEIALNPARSNPTVATKLGVGAVGEGGVNYELSQQNLPKFNKAARVDLGLPENTPLDEAALNKYMERHSTSNLVIDKIGPLENTKSTLGELSGLMLDEKRTSDKAKFAAVNEVVVRARDQIAEGLTGSEVLDQIRGFRHDAKRVLQNATAGPNEIEVAKTKLKLAKTFENLIENNLADDSIIDLYRKERTAQAKGYDWERAIDPITKQVDPNQLAADVRNGLKLTGTLRDLADIAGAYPEIASMRPLITPDPYTMMRRGGAGGTIGFATLGGPEGAAVGAGFTSMAGRVAAKGMKSPGFQQSFAIPPDRRMALPPVEGLSRPNFTMAETGPYSPMPPVPNKMLGYNPSAPSVAEAQMNRLRAEDVMGQQFIRNQILAEEGQQAAAEAASRQPTRGGINLEWDPMTKTYREPSAMMKGATPDIQIIESTGKSLSGAADLLASGKSPALMSAEQRIAWEKTKVDLADVVPGMKALSDKSLANKMLDRAWLQETIDKAKQKAQMYADIAARSDNERLRQDALMKREIAQGNLEMLEEQYRKARPVKTGGQGPKTRAFQRNMLRPEGDEIQNALVK